MKMQREAWEVLGASQGEGGGWEGKGGRCKLLEVGGGCAPGRN